MIRRRTTPTGARRLVAVFAVTVLIPAVALAVLAYQGVSKEKRALRAEREGALNRAALLIRRELVETFEKLRREEEARPYYQYNALFVDPNHVGFGLNYFPSPIAEIPPNPLVEGYFQVDPKGVLRSPNDPLLVARTKKVPAPRTGQEKRTQRTLDSARQSILPQVQKDQQDTPKQEMGVFPRNVGMNQEQLVTRSAAVANAQFPENFGRIIENQSEPPARVTEKSPEEPPAEEEKEAPPQEERKRPEELLEVVASPFSFESAGAEGVLAQRFVDVPNDSPDFGGRPVLRYVQGFRIDTVYLEEVLFPELVKRYLDVPGGLAVLVPDGAPGPIGQEILTETLPIPGYRLVVTDSDPGWVDRRAARLSTVLLAVAGGLLFVILGGLFFTVRTVRTELSLARRKSDFVAAVTHELRTPLTGIRMYADLLRAGWVKNEETRSEYVDFMADETDRLTRLVNRVLDFARTDRGEIAVAPLHLAGPIGDVKQSFGPFVSGKGFELIVQIEDDRPALAEPDGVKQILLNLIENAVKYAAGAKDFRITVRVAAEGEHTVLSVVDHGPGIPAKEREKVFLDFYRPGEELTRENQGTGIGLALVRRLSAAMGGRAEVVETPGGGATFRVVLKASIQ